MQQPLICLALRAYNVDTTLTYERAKYTAASVVMDSPYASSAEAEVADEKDAFLSETNPRRARRPSRWTRSFSCRGWMTSLIINTTSSFLLAAIFVAVRDYTLPRNDYEAGFRTDIATPFKIPMVEVRASGSPIFKPGKIMEMPPFRPGLPWPENVSYTGNPSQQEEDNWAVLIDQASFPITLAEAKRAWPENYRDYYLEKEGKYRAAMDMFHTLHCVNVFRRLTEPGAYERDMDPHMNHCVEMLRQHVMCYGSTTLIPTKWVREIERPYIDANQVHTCRDFNTLHAYMMSRRDPQSPLYAGNQPRE